MRRLSFVMALAAALCAGAAHAGPFGGSISESIVAKDMNAAGDTVLESITGYGARQAFLRSGGMRYEIGTFGGEESRAAAINNAGVVTGSAQMADYTWWQAPCKCPTAVGTPSRTTATVRWTWA